MNEPARCPALMGLVAALVSATLLAGCGGGGDAPAPQPVVPAPPPPAPAPAPEPPPAAASLPASLTISAPAVADVGQTLVLASDLGDGREGLSLEWDFGDGSKSSLARPAHAFAQAGVYDLRLTVSNPAGQSVIALHSIQVGRNSTLAGLQCSKGTGAGWCWQRPQPFAFDINDVFFIDPLRGWAVGSEGIVQATADSGKTWVRQAFPVGDDLSVVHFVSATQGWVIIGEWDQPVRIAQTLDAGRTWQVMGDVPLPKVSRLRTSGANALVAIVDEGSGPSAVSIDGGRSWRQLPRYVLEATQTGALVEYVEPGALHVSDDLGVTDRPLLPCTANCSIAAYELSDGVNLSVLRHEAASTQIPQYRELVHQSSDGGRHWATSNVLRPAELHPNGLLGQVSLFPGGSGWAVASLASNLQQVFLQTRDGGRSWTMPALPDALKDARWGAGIDGRTAWISVQGRVWLTTDAAATWRPVDTPASSGQLVMGIRRAGPGVLLADFGVRISFSPMVIVPFVEQRHMSTDDGLSWISIPGASVTQATAVTGFWFFDTRRGLAQGSDGTLLATTDGGLHWSVRSTPPFFSPGGAADLHFTRDGTGFRVVQNRLWRSSDGGQTWSELSLPSAAEHLLYHAQFVDGRQGWTATIKCQDGLQADRCTYSLYATADGGLTWTLLPSVLDADRNPQLHFLDSREGVLARADGSVMRTADGGITWQSVSIDRPSSAAPVHLSFTDAKDGWLLRNDRDAPLLHTTDGGLSWRSVALPTGLPALASVRFFDALNGWVVGDQGLVLRTTNGGASWVRQNSGSNLALQSVFAVDADTAWLGGDAGSILSTVTGGR